MNVISISDIKHFVDQNFPFVIELKSVDKLQTENE